MPLDSWTLAQIRAAAPRVRAPTKSDKVYKDECVFSFDTPFSPPSQTGTEPGGVAVNLSTWLGYSPRLLSLDADLRGSGPGPGLYLLQNYRRIPLSDEEKTRNVDLAREGKLLLGAGASSLPVYKSHSLLVRWSNPPPGSPSFVISALPDADLPIAVSQACDAVIAHDGMRLRARTEAFVHEFEVKESKYAAGLEQLPAKGKTIPSDPSMWKCDETGVTENLWLNLGTGFVGSGRRHWDGSGGNGASGRHFEATGSKYPLVVKLGTITPESADVFSYAPDENDMVLDPKLSDHLAHWGINIKKKKKTEKSMDELNAEINIEFGFDSVLNSKDPVVSSPGCVGIENLGNSCYMNSIVQVLFSAPEIVDRYFQSPDEACDPAFTSAPADPTSDFITQMARLAHGLFSPRYAPPLRDPEEELAGPDPNLVRIHPATFKSLVGKGHPEFSTGRQQDAAEYLQHLLQTIVRAERAAMERLGGDKATTTASLFTATVESRTQCLESNKVSYSTCEENIIGVPIPLDAAVNGEEYRSYQEHKRAKLDQQPVDVVAAKVPFEACLERLFGDGIVDDFMSSATGKNGKASKRVRLKTFPPYLTLRMDRYYVGDDWQPKKMEVEVPVPLELDLERFRGRGIQPDEEELPAPSEDATTPAAPEPEIDMVMVLQLQEMGFSENGCKRAVRAAGQGGIEAASNWIFAHMGDADFNDPVPEVSAHAATAIASNPSPVDPEAVANLAGLGFTHEQAEAALSRSNGSAERAADWLFSHMDDLDGAIAALRGEERGQGDTEQEIASSLAPADDGPGRYELHAIVSHLGKATGSGHYVAHVRKVCAWICFNDEKVSNAVEKGPPLEHGYLYVFRRRS